MVPFKILMKNLDEMKWFGHASFSFVDENGSRIYYVDPFDLKVKKLEAADIIFITHVHSDHFSPSDIAKILKNNTLVVATNDVLEKIDLPRDKKIEVKPNQSYTIKDFLISG